MQVFKFSLSSLLVFALLSFSQTVSADGVTWSHDLKNVLTKRNKKVVIVVFTQEDSQAFATLDNMVFSNDDFAEVVQPYVSFVRFEEMISQERIDSQPAEERKLATAWIEQLGIETFPSIVVFTPSGKPTMTLTIDNIMSKPSWTALIGQGGLQREAGMSDRDFQKKKAEIARLGKVYFYIEWVKGLKKEVKVFNKNHKRDLRSAKKAIAKLEEIEKANPEYLRFYPDLMKKASNISNREGLREYWFLRYIVAQARSLVVQGKVDKALKFIRKPLQRFLPAAVFQEENDSDLVHFASMRIVLITEYYPTYAKIQFQVSGGPSALNVLKAGVQAALDMGYDEDHPIFEQYELLEEQFSN